VQRVEALGHEQATAAAHEVKEEPKSLLPPAPPITGGKNVADQPPSVPAAEREPSPRRARTSSDAVEIDRDLQRLGRPTIRLDGTLEKKTPPAGPAATPLADDDQPAWLKPVKAPPQPPPASKELGISTGAHIKARLLTNLDSRTVGDGPAEAKLVRPFILDGRAVLPSGTIVLGQAQASGSRFTIRFYRLRLPDRREIAFEGLAYDSNERKPGLPASRRIESSKQGEPIVSKIAKGAADTVLTAASTGDLASSLAVGAGRTALNERGEQTLSETGAVLLLDASVDFDVFVVHAF
jgi:hypothetical protein